MCGLSIVVGTKKLSLVEVLGTCTCGRSEPLERAHDLPMSLSASELIWTCRVKGSRPILVVNVGIVGRCATTRVWYLSAKVKGHPWPCNTQR